MSEIMFASATRQARLIARGEISPVELVSGYLERIERLDPQLNSFVTVIGEQALEDARRAQRALGHHDLPPFHGVPNTIKDLPVTAGVRPTASTKAFADTIGEVDASSVRRIKEAGFIILGKTNTGCAAIRGTRRVHRGARAAGPRLRSRRGCAPLLMAVTAADRFASRRLAAGSWV